MRKKITISEVAKSAGVSTTTVSRVMSGTGRISELTRQRVFSVIEKLDYQPSAIAKGLIESKTYNIGLILSPNPEDYNSYENNFFQLFLQGAVTVLKKFQYDIVITYGEESDERALEKFVKRQKVEGLIVMKALKNSNHILKLKKMDFPFVVLGEPNIPNVHFVDININKIIFELIEKLSETCSNRIAFLASDLNLCSNSQKAISCTDALIQKGYMPNENYIHIGNNFFERELFLKNFIEDSKKNKAIITADYNSLLYTINYLNANKIKIPTDVQVVTFNDNNLLSILSPTITAVQTPAIDMGEKAATILINIITKGELHDNFILDGSIAYRQSTL